MEGTQSQAGCDGLLARNEAVFVDPLRQYLFRWNAREASRRLYRPVWPEPTELRLRLAVATKIVPAVISLIIVLSGRRPLPANSAGALGVGHVAKLSRQPRGRSQAATPGSYAQWPAGHGFDTV
jgi:hypothetical protein